MKEVKGGGLFRSGRGSSQPQRSSQEQRAEAIPQVCEPSSAASIETAATQTSARIAPRDLLTARTAGYTAEAASSRVGNKNISHEQNRNSTPLQHTNGGATFGPAIGTGPGPCEPAAAGEAGPGAGCGHPAALSGTVSPGATRGGRQSERSELASKRLTMQQGVEPSESPCTQVAGGKTLTGTSNRNNPRCMAERVLQQAMRKALLLLGKEEFGSVQPIQQPRRNVLRAIIVPIVNHP